MGVILLAFISACVVGKEPNTPNGDFMADETKYIMYVMQWETYVNLISFRRNFIVQYWYIGWIERDT